jgi:HAD superfamily phosphoserine phosphatase-like hydrolase
MGNGGQQRRPRYATVALDVDSTLSGIEGIDWLAELRSEKIAAFVHRLTRDAMSGKVALEDVYAQRLTLLAPTRADVVAMADVYRTHVAARARNAVGTLTRAGVRVVAISGGLRDAVLPLCRDVGIADGDVHAVSVHFDAKGQYAGYDAESPLTTHDGKPTVLRSLALPRPILSLGDGATDAAMKAAGAADAFAAFTGFVRREPVVGAADHVIASFDELLALVLPNTD